MTYLSKNKWGDNSMITLSLKNDTNVIAQACHHQEAYLAFKDYVYQEGDYIEVTLDQANQHIWVQVDEAIEASLIYMGQLTWKYPVILDENLKRAYSPKAFLGERHYIRVWLPEEVQVYSERNLARNAHDQKDESGAYPHAYANVETRNDSTFFARNAIDGILANQDHGSYPYQSWGINQRKDAELTIDFGREVLVNSIALVLRGDYPHDSYWTQVTLALSNGQEHILQTTNQLDRQYFKFPETSVTHLTLKNLIKHEDNSPFPALTQIEVYGTESI